MCKRKRSDTTVQMPPRERDRIRFVEKYKFLVFTNDLKVDEEIKNRRNAMLGNLQQYKDAISSKHLSLAFKKIIVRVGLDESLFYGAEI